MSARVYVDVDDVLARTTEGLIDLLERHHGRRVPFDACHDFDLRVSFALGQEDHDRLLDEAHADPFLEGVAAMPGAARVLAELRRSGFAIDVRTGRPPDSLPATRSWLHRHTLPHDSLVSVDKYGRHGHLPDAQPLAALARERFALAIEDNVATARFLARATGARVLLFDRPWNRDADPGHPAIQRITSWDDVSLAR